MTSNNRTNDVLRAKERTSGTAPPPGTVDLYCGVTPALLEYYGNAWDKGTLCMLSETADRQINKEKYEKITINGRHATHVPLKRALEPVNRINLLKCNKEGVYYVLQWINNNSRSNLKPIEISKALFPNGPHSFATLIYMHQADHAFRLKREIRGQAIRDAIFKHIHNRDRAHVITYSDFKVACEEVNFDARIRDNMMHQVMWRSIDGTMVEEELARIQQYCWEHGLYEEMLAQGEKCIQIKQANREKQGKMYGRPIQHGW